jgi:hypothetical protein
VVIFVKGGFLAEKRRMQNPFGGRTINGKNN